MESINDRATQSRVNGAKSKGPKTKDGLRKCTNSSLKHGMYTNQIILDNEDPKAYQALKKAYQKVWKPADPFEKECVMNLVNARWKQARLEALETKELNLAVGHQCQTKVHDTILTTLEKRLHTLTSFLEQVQRAIAHQINLLQKHRRQKINQAKTEANSKEGPEPTIKESGILAGIAKFLLKLILMMAKPKRPTLLTPDPWLLFFRSSKTSASKNPVPGIQSVPAGARRGMDQTRAENG